MQCTSVRLAIIVWARVEATPSNNASGKLKSITAISTNKVLTGRLPVADGRLTFSPEPSSVMRRKQINRKRSAECHGRKLVAKMTRPKAVMTLT